MSIKRTVINADEELVIKGKLTIEGNVTQIETTQQVTNLQGNVFTINSDGSNTSAVLALNSNGTVASFTFDSANGSIIVNKPINLGSQNISTTGNITGAYIFGNGGSLTGLTTTIVAEGTNLYFTSARANSAINTYLVGGAGLTYSSGTFAVGAGTGITVNADDVQVNAAYVTSLFSVTDAGGDGSLAYNSSTGVITYTGPSASEVRAHISAGTGITFSSGVIATTITQYTDALARAAVSATDAGGDGSFSYNSSTGVFTYTGPSASEVRAHIIGGNGIDYANGNISVNSTVIRTSGEQTITGNTSFVGNVSITGNLDVTANINSLNVVDLNVQDTQIILNANAASGANSNIAVNRGGDPTVYIKWNESIDVWSFTNNGTVEYRIPTSTTDLNEGNNLYFTTGRVNTAIDAYIIGGNGLTYSSGTIAVGTGTGITVNADNVAVDNTVIRTTGDQTVTGNTTFVGTLIIPGSNATANGAIFTRGPQVFAYVDGIEKELTPQVDIGVVTTADAGNTGIDVYAGMQMVGNVTTHFIRSIDGGTYTTASLGSNVITIDGNITAIRGSLSTANVAGYGNLSYNSSNGLFSYSGVTDSQIRTLFSGSGLITYNSANGSITTSADNYSSWTVQTDSGAGAAEAITSGEKLTIQSGTGITVTNAGNVITITNDSVADIESVSAGSGLTGGGDSGNLTLNIGAGDGITVNADNVSVDTTVVRTTSNQTIAGDKTFTGNTNIGSYNTDNNFTGRFKFNRSGVGSGDAIAPNGDVIWLTDGHNDTDACEIIFFKSRPTSSPNTGDAIGGINFKDGYQGNNCLSLISYYESSGKASLKVLNNNLSNTVIEFTSDSKVKIANSYILPNTDGTAGQKLTTYGNGIVYWSTESADITEVVAGNGLTGGGSSGSVTLNIGAGAGITVNADTIALTSGVITVGTYGTASAVPAVTVDTYGRVTSIANTNISITASQVSDFTSAANTAIDARVSGGSGLTYASGVLSVGAGSYITVAADTVAVDATTTNTPSKVVARDGAGNVYANYFVGTATSAQYADLAENYLADADYLPGTVLVFGGEEEVTAATTPSSTRIAGVVTTQPAHVMNSHLVGPHVVCIALRGRVPVKVMGVVRKGDVLVSAGEGHIGYAIAALYARDVPAAAMVGKAISDKLDTGPGVVEALI